MTRPHIFLTLCFFAGLPGCATVEGASVVASVSPAVRRGEGVAIGVCAECHAIGSSRSSPTPGAPPFVDMMHRYDPSALERELEAITDVGHYRMPPLTISRLDRSDLVAYIDSLD